MKIRTLIADDEMPARSRLRDLLAAEPDVDIVDEAADGEEAIAAIVELRPDLLFLDIQMPPPDGLTVLRTVRDVWLPYVIFTTAYAEHAVAAFELHALDYLLKPFTRERLAAAVTRARTHLAKGERADDPQVAALLADAAVPAQPLERFMVKNGRRYAVVRSADLEWVEAAANYVVLHTSEGNHVLRRTLSTIERDLDPQRFFRTGRSAIVNLDAVREVRMANADEHIVVLRSGARVALTRGLRELQERLQTGAVR